MAEYTSSYTGAQIDAAVGRFNGDVLDGVQCIELNKNGGSVGTGGFIDFHYNGSSSDYTCRIIESAMGVLRFKNNIFVEGSAMLATDTGNVGIGTSSPGYKLDVNGDIFSNSGFYVNYGGTAASSLYPGSLELNGGPDTPGITLTNSANKEAYIAFSSSGKLTFSNSYYKNFEFDGNIYTDGLRSNSSIEVQESGAYGYYYGDHINLDGTYPAIEFIYDGDDSYEMDMYLNDQGILEVQGDESEFKFWGTVYAQQFSNLSDMRKKDVIGDVTLNLDNIANAPLFKFTWKDERMKGEHIGSSAQYWQEVLPEAISVDKDPMQSLSMNYGAVALASAITTAKSVVNHEERITALEKENALLKKEIEAIKAA